jgi:hypothetical protein
VIVRKIFRLKPASPGTGEMQTFTRSYGEKVA